MVARLGRRSSSPAPLPPMRLSCTGLDRCFAHTRQPCHALPYWTLRADTNAPCEIPHIMLTGFARVAHWTDFFARCFDALTLFGASTIMTGMTAAMRDLVLMMSVTPKY